MPTTRKQLLEPAAKLAAWYIDKARCAKAGVPIAPVKTEQAWAQVNRMSADEKRRTLHTACEILASIYTGGTQ